MRRVCVTCTSVVSPNNISKISYTTLNKGHRARCELDPSISTLRWLQSHQRLPALSQCLSPFPFSLHHKNDASFFFFSFFRSNHFQSPFSRPNTWVLQELRNRCIRLPPPLLPLYLLSLGFPFPFPSRLSLPSTLHSSSLNAPPKRQSNARAYVPNHPTRLPPFSP